MSKQIVHMRIEKELRESVKDLADSEFDGNFTAAVESLLGQSLRLRAVETNTRWAMYSAAKNANAHIPMSDQQYNEFIRTLTDGLYI
jgi:hypothetical protein